MTESKIKFSAVVSFEISESDAIEILADPQPGYKIEQWLNSHFPCENSPVEMWKNGYMGYNAGELQKQLGRNLAIQKLAERKQLGAPSVIDIGTRDVS